RGADHAFIPCRGPFRSTSTKGKRIGRDVGKRSRAGLRVYDVLYELLREGGNVKGVASGSPENTGIAHPSETLIALRTIGRNAEVISALAPQADLPHVIDEVAGGRELGSRLATAATQNLSFDRVEIWLARIPSHVDSAKAVKREMGCERFFPTACE